MKDEGWRKRMNDKEHEQGTKDKGKRTNKMNEGWKTKKEKCKMKDGQWTEDKRWVTRMGHQGQQRNDKGLKISNENKEQKTKDKRQ